MTGETAGRAACEAHDLALFGDGHDPDIWASRGDRERAAWEDAALAAWPVLAAQLEAARAAAARLEEIRAVLTAFDWEHDDRQYALEQIDRLVNGDRP